MKKLLFIFLISLLALLNSCRPNSHVGNPILHLAESLMQSHPDSALHLLEGIASPQEMKKADRAFYALLLTQARYKNYILLDNDSLIQVAVDYYKDIHQKELLAKSYFYMGCYYRDSKKLPASIELYLKALRTMPRQCDSVFLSMIYNHLGDCYSEQGLDLKAREMYRDGYALNMSKNDSLRAFHNLKGIGATYMMQFQFDSASHYYQQALTMALSQDYPELLGIIYKQLAGVYSAQGNYKQAYSAISNALPYLTDIVSLCSAYSVKGDLLYSLNEKDSALHYWYLSKESPDIYTKTSNYYNIYTVSKELHDLQNAVLYVDSFITCYDSIQGMNDRAEIAELTDNHLLELHKYKLSIEKGRTINLLIVMFIFSVFVLAFFFMRRDRRRKSEYIALQKQLMDNRVETLLLNDNGEQVENEKLHELEEARVDICISLFKSTEGYKWLNELKNAKPKERLDIISTHRVLIITDIRRTFVDVMADLSNSCSSLTPDDLLYCTLIMLHCPKEIIMDIMNTTSDAIKTRKSRIKNKMGHSLFEKVFSTDNL